MITSVSEYRQRLYNIQTTTGSMKYTTLPSDEPRFVIDANTRTIKIPDTFAFLSVQYEHRAETIYFEIDRYFDNEDLSTHTCVVQFINGIGQNKNEGIYPVTDVDVDSVDGKIIFGWKIGNDATQFASDIYFSVRFYTLNSDQSFLYNFNTIPASSTILKTIDVRESSVAQVTPSEIQIWIDRMDTISRQSELLLNESNLINQNTNERLDNAIQTFGKFADFYLEDNVLCATTVDDYNVTNMSMDDDGYLYISLEIEGGDVA